MSSFFEGWASGSVENLTIDRKTPMKMECPCPKPHASYQTLARCIFDRPMWVDGEGRYASISLSTLSRFKGNTATVRLYKSLESAQEGLNRINRTSCDRQCQQNHRIVELVMR